MPIRTVCVYCGSSNHVDPSYFQTAEELARLLVKNGYDIVYGGGHVGLMGAMAEAALNAGGKVTGIIPEHLRNREVQQDNLTELIVVPNMHVRKAAMAERADAFLILPGGFGTLDEAFEILTWKQLGLHNKPIILYNQNNFWDPMMKLIDKIVTEGFAPQDNLLIYHEATKPDQVVDLLQAPPDPVVRAENKWQ